MKYFLCQSLIFQPHEFRIFPYFHSLLDLLLFNKIQILRDSSLQNFLLHIN